MTGRPRMGSSLAQVVLRLGPAYAARRLRLDLKSALVERDPWYDTDDTSQDDAVFILGCGRSGTTLLREMLARHSRIACGPETAILCDIVNPSRLAAEWRIDEREIRRQMREAPSVVRFAEAFFRADARRQGKPRWADKTPRNVRVLPRLLAQFPRARVIHVIRDGRDVACSLRNHPKEAIRHGRLVPVEKYRRIRNCSRRWLSDTGMGVALRAHPRVAEVRYEDLVTDPGPHLRRLCAFLGESFEPAMLEGGMRDEAGRTAARLLNSAGAASEVHSRSVGRWRRDLSPAERVDFARVAGELLIALGYAPDSSWIDEPHEPRIEARPGGAGVPTEPGALETHR